jgi:hypothetical protein
MIVHAYLHAGSISRLLDTLTQPYNLNPATTHFHRPMFSPSKQEQKPFHQHFLVPVLVPHNEYARSSHKQHPQTLHAEYLVNRPLVFRAIVTFRVSLIRFGSLERGFRVS